MPTQEQINDLEKTLHLIEVAAKQPVPVGAGEEETQVRWYQGEWLVPRWSEANDPTQYSTIPEDFCGTGACLCGTRALLDGAHIVGTNNVRIGDGRYLNTAESWEHWGAERFGLDRHDARILFDYQNTVSLLRHYVEQVKAGDLPLVKREVWEFSDPD
jgi:hypothetical protein